MKWLLFGAAAAASLACVPSYAQNAGKSIVVTGRPLTLAKWSESVGRELDRHLSYPRVPMGRSMPSGTAKIAFLCSEDGRPSKVAVTRSSGDRFLDRAAMRAVTRISTLHPMPAGLKPDQRYEANILFAASDAQYVRELRRLQADAARRNAWFRDDPNQAIVFNIPSRGSARTNGRAGS